MEQYRINPDNGLEFGIYTLGDHLPDPHTGQRQSEGERVREIIRFAQLAEQAGVDFFSVGESHQEYFATQAHSVVLAAIAQATTNIKVSSSSTIISTSDPVRVFEDFATIDLISQGRAEIIAGRASRVGLFDLLGYDIRYYEELYEEKFELLLDINKQQTINWNGRFRASLKDAQILPRPESGSLPIWRAVGGHPSSAIKAGRAGVPMMLATLGGPAETFKTTIDAYRNAANAAGHDAAQLPVATAGFFNAAETTQQAIAEYYPHVDKGMVKTNGRGYPQEAFAHGATKESVMNIGSPQQIIEKILYQHELFGHQRYIAQMDFGGVPMERLERNLELLATEILPAVRKYTRKE